MGKTGTYAAEATPKGSCASQENVTGGKLKVHCPLTLAFLGKDTEMSVYSAAGE